VSKRKQTTGTTSRKRTKQSRSKQRAAVDQAPSLWGDPKAQRAALAGAIALVIIIGFALSIKPLRKHVAALRSAERIEVSLAFPGSPAPDVGALNDSAQQAGGAPVGGLDWLPDAEKRRIITLIERDVSSDPFDVESLRRARSALLATGWFSSVTSVRRGPGGKVVVDATWRSPAAAVRWKGRDYLVSQEATLLPLTFDPGAPDEPRVILGAAVGPPTDANGAAKYGARWPRADVAAAVTLLKRIRERDDAWRRVAAVDVSRWSKNGALAIISPDGAEIVWGSAPGEEQPWESPPEKKLDVFVGLWQDDRWLSRGKPLVELHRPIPEMDTRPGG